MSAIEPGRLPTRVELLDGELFHSYVRRLTAANDLTPSYLGASRGIPNIASVERVADAGGIDPARLDTSVVRRGTLDPELQILRLRTCRWDCRGCSQRDLGAMHAGYAFVFTCISCGALFGPEPFVGPNFETRSPARMLQVQRRLIAQLSESPLDPGVRRRIHAFGPAARRLARGVYQERFADRDDPNREGCRPLFGLPELPELFADMFELCWDYAGSPATVDLVTVAMKGAAGDPDLQRLKSAIVQITDLALSLDLDADSIPTDIRYAADDVMIPAEDWAHRRQVCHALSDWVRGVQARPPRLPRRDHWTPDPASARSRDIKRARQLIFEVEALIDAMASRDLLPTTLSLSPRTPAHIIQQMVSGPALRSAKPALVERWRWAHEVLGTNAAATTPWFHYGELVEFDRNLTPQERLDLLDYFEREDRLDSAVATPARSLTVDSEVS